MTVIWSSTSFRDGKHFWSNVARGRPAGSTSLASRSIITASEWAAAVAELEWICSRWKDDDDRDTICCLTFYNIFWSFGRCCCCFCCFSLCVLIPASSFPISIPLLMFSMCVLFLPWWASNEQNKGTNGTVDRQPAVARCGIIHVGAQWSASLARRPSSTPRRALIRQVIYLPQVFIYLLFFLFVFFFQKKSRLIPLSYCVPTNPYSSSTVQFQRNITHEPSIQISTKQKMKFSSYLARPPLNDENRRKTIFKLHCQPTSLKLMPSCSFQVLFLTSPTYLINYLDSTKTNWTFLLQVFIIIIVVLLRIMRLGF